MTSHCLWIYPLWDVMDLDTAAAQADLLLEFPYDTPLHVRKALPEISLVRH